MKDLFSTDLTLGILGGGQLGKMLLTETRKYDIRTKVLDPSADAPGRLSCNQFVQGDFKDFDTVYSFGKDVQYLTIEIESVNTDALEKLRDEGVSVNPSPEVIKIIQNKAGQKEFYRDHQIATSPFLTFGSKAELLEAVEQGSVTIPFVWKAASGGYDGFGVSIVKKKEDLYPLGEGACIAEDLIPFEKELSVIVARNAQGEMKCFPTVEMEFHPTANQVEYVLCPADLSNDLDSKARDLAMKVADALKLEGVLAVEMFLTREGEILVNESAPRTHNSGHLTIENNYTSQFEQHLRAVLGLPLGDTTMKCPAVMANLVGAEGHSGDVTYEGYGDLLAMAGVNIHIYGKRQTRPFRKMGHVTVIGKTRAEAREMAERAKEGIQVKSIKS